MGPDRRRVTQRRYSRSHAPPLFGGVALVPLFFSRSARRGRNGWGGWEKTIEGAVNRAVSLCIEYRSQLTEDDAVKKMVSYVKNCEGSE